MIGGYWDKLKQHQRRELWRKRVMIVVTVLFVAVVAATLHESEPPHPLPDLSDVVVERAAATAKEADTQPPTAATAVTTPTERPVPSPAPREETLVEQREAAARAKLRYEQTYAVLDPSWLVRHGGAEWAEVRRLVEQATAASQPSDAAAAYTQAAKTLQAAVPQMKWRELTIALKTGGSAEALRALQQFRQESPHYPRAVDAALALRDWSATDWLHVAEQQRAQMAPDDPGFAEVGLVFAATHDLRGDAPASRDAVRQAWVALERMTDAERRVETAIDVWQRQRAEQIPSSARLRLREIAGMTESISDRARRAELLADLSGLAGMQAETQAASDLLERALAVPRQGSFLNSYSEIIRCRALWRTTSTADMLRICRGVKKHNGSRGNDPFPANAMCYGYAAMAAARELDEAAFLRCRLLALAQLASLPMTSYPRLEYAERVVAQADLLHHNWDRAVITSQNLPTPSLRGSLVLPVLQERPQAVPTKLARQSLRDAGGTRGATLAAAAFVAQQALGGEPIMDLIDWADELPHDSLRVATFLGIARAVQRGVPPPSPLPEQPMAVSLTTIADMRLLVENSEQWAATINAPLDRGYAWLWIARTWLSLDKPASAQHALNQAHAAAHAAWEPIWDRRGPAHRGSLGSSFYAGQPQYFFKPNFRTQQAQNRAVVRLADFHIQLARTQVDFNPQAALQSCLDAGLTFPLLPDGWIRGGNVLWMQALLARTLDQTGIPLQTLDWPFYHRVTTASIYRDSVGVAAAGDVPRLRQRLEALRNMARRGDIDRLARVEAELALLLARAGDLTGYRELRRQVVDRIQRQQALNSLELVLAEADAVAGEFALAEKNLGHKSLRWYGPVDRPRSVLAVQLAQAGRWDEAATQIARLSPSEPFWRMQAVDAVAAARLRSASESVADSLAWAHGLTQPLDRIAAQCGFARAGGE